MDNFKNRLHKLPKGDVHNHLHLGGCIDVLKKKYPNKNLEIPKYYVGIEGLIDFINTHVNSLLLTSKDVVFF